MTGPRDVVALFLEGARAVAGAISDPAVAEAWDRPSVLEEQLVSGLAGHLARGGVWVVADYLQAGTPSGPVDFEGAGQYFAELVGAASPDDHRAIRDRGAAVAAGKVMRLADYLATRVVEQVVHLDDLARSTQHEPWPYPRAGQELAIEVATDIACQRHGGTAVVRALYRHGYADAILPLL